MIFLPISRYLAAFCFAVMALWPAHAVEGTKRVALVIGNSAYRSIEPLPNPVNDATDIAQKLKSLGFEVLLATDAGQAEMRTLLGEFQSRLTRDYVGLVFYAGHGVTINGESFLLPVDVPQAIEVDDKGQLGSDKLNLYLVSLASLLEPLEGSRIGIVFLDACRTNAAERDAGAKLRVVSLGTQRAVPILRGTGSVQVKPSAHSAGVFRAYATQLDNVASDGAGRNSPFTRALLKHIGTQGISIQELMLRVRKSVMEETNNQQIPWEEAALNDNFYFVTPSLAAPGTAGPQRPATSAARPATSSGGAARNSLPPNIGMGVGGGF